MRIRGRAQAAFALLRQAQALAQDLRRSVWDFAVEIDCLRTAGLTNSDLRWLLGRGLLEHAHETTQPGEEGRSFAPLGKMMLTPATCFVLAQSEFALALGLAADGITDDLPVEPDAAAPFGGDRDEVPVWDRDRQELRFGGLLVKQFKLPAPNQEIVLATFEEEQWPARIDDPLPGNPGQDAKRRLHETITSLNRKQKQRLVRFMGDGSGEGVRWERVPSPAATLARAAAERVSRPPAQLR